MGPDRPKQLALALITLVFVAYQAPLCLQLGANAEEVAPLLDAPPQRLSPGPEQTATSPGLHASEGLPVWSWIGSDGSMTPLMIDGHVGALSFAGARLLSGLGGLKAARLQSTVLGVLGLLAIFALAGRLGGPAAGLLAAALAATSAQYVFAHLMIRPDEQLDSLALVLAILAFLRHHDTGEKRWFYGACLLIGVALMAKNTALWALLGIGVAAVTFKLAPRAHPRDWAIGAALAAIPLLPQAAYVLTADTGGAFTDRLAQISAPWVGLAPDNLLFSLRHFDESFGHAGTLLAGYTQATAGDPWIPAVGYVILAAVALSIASAGRRDQPTARRAFGLGLGVTLALYWMLYYRGASYYLLLTPWIPIATALAVVTLWRDAARPLRSALVVLLSLLAVNAAAEATRMVDAVRNPETGMFDGDAQQALAQRLQADEIAHPYSTTYAAVGVYELLTRGAVRPRSLWPYFRGAGDQPATFDTAWRAVFKRLGPGVHTVLLSPNASPVENSEGVAGHLIAERFDGAAAAAGARVDLVETWSAPSGHPILRLVRLTLQ